MIVDAVSGQAAPDASPTVVFAFEVTAEADVQRGPLYRLRQAARRAEADRVGLTGSAVLALLDEYDALLAEAARQRAAVEAEQAAGAALAEAVHALDGQFLGGGS